MLILSVLPTNPNQTHAPSLPLLSLQIVNASTVLDVRLFQKRILSAISYATHSRIMLPTGQIVTRTSADAKA
jgi:hypothetical protein